MTMKRWIALASLLLSLLLLGGCATNPVTGERELSLVDRSSEVALGEKEYLPSRQQQGGDYVVDPALTRYVQRVGARLAAVADRDLPYEFVVVNDSTPNAWALPGGKIAVNRGLLTELRNEAELAAVLGHEIVHAAARHGAQSMERSVLLQAALLAAGVAAGASDNDNAALLLGAASVGAGLINQKYSRDAELEADHYGMIYMQRAGYDPQAAVALQQTFVRLAEGRDQNWLTGLFASHPPSQERVEKNRQMARQLGAGKGRIGEAEYRRATARLRRDKPAYAAYDEGRKLLRKSPEKSLRLAQKAIAIEPEEGLFHELLGDALTLLDRPREARRAYDRAVRLNDGFFRPYLKRGALEADLGEREAARRDLQRSQQLLPTRIARQLLDRLNQ
ncbi:MAG TPA: peptidase M48 [Sedimenticola thiotaurini]|uniref:Peptidase M48 n=1 Tax=Sedimenticola thiotaurini TaxID=1543721 RepID=A0A831RPH2_9GAMM|nr:peptidase M48 [Sedimenticola thiotaurini]